MTAAGVQAWITSAVEDKAVRKAIVLAGSLRRVYTAKKLAVLTTLAVSRELREKLKEAFDLVLLLEQETPNGLLLEDYAKVQAFSLLVFNKCVYLSPDTVVLRNCDEIFEKYETFAACENKNEVDSSVYVFSPSLDNGRALDKIVQYVNVTGDKRNGDFSKYFNVWMRNHIPNASNLDERYNLKIDVDAAEGKSLKVDVSIANFSGLHPLEIAENILTNKLQHVGPVEKFAVERCLEIYSQDIKPRINNELVKFTRSQYENEPVAIIGLSFRLPGGNNADEFWDLLSNGREGIKMVPSFRWKREHLLKSCKNRNIEAGFLDIPVDEFDAKFFGISPKEAEFLDPQQRLLHEVAWEALEDAMIDPHTLRGTQTGVFVGSWIHDYKDISIKSNDLDFFRVYMGNSLAAEAARLSHFFETTGPSIATESGCSSGIVAVHMACKSLQKHESKMAFACGVNLLLHPFDSGMLSFVVAPDGRCKTFDSKADGFGRAEGCGVLLMKRLSDAVKDGNDIWGLIRGSAVTQEGVSKSLGTPTVHCESLAMEMALKDSGVCPRDVSYIETHGTGTSVGDPLEVAAIAKAYSKGRTEPVVIGSVKTNVGHTESASGITGIIKVLLSMKHELIPPHLNLETLNPAVNLDAIPAELPLTSRPWPKCEKPRLAGVSSFGISGTDGHAIIQDAPATFVSQLDYKLNRPLHILKISAKSQESMDILLSKYQNICIEKCDAASNDEFSNLCYSANIGRATFNHRAVIIAKNFSEATTIFQKKTFLQGDVQSNGNSLCFLFTGQGSQYPKMAASLYDTSPIFRDHFDQCEKVLANKYGIDIREVLWGKSGNGAELSRTLFSQTSIFCVEYCLLKLWESWGVKADYVMGHSLGEFAAAVAAGALDFEDAIMLVAERSRLIDNLPQGKMLVIRADKKTVDQFISKFKELNSQFWVDYAAVNTSDQTVVAGDSHHIEAFSKFCEEKSLKTIVLAASHAFHSRHMDPILAEYKRIASTVKKSKIPDDAPKYISGMEGKFIETRFLDANYWVRHTREKVSFIDACKAVQVEGCSLFLEVGPHPVLSAFAMMNIEHTVTCLPSLRRGKDEWGTMLETLAKLYLSDWKGEINWKGFDRYYKRSRVTLPFYPFNRKPIWTEIRQTPGVIHPLLGKLLPNASGRSVFENELTVKTVNYIQDHAIGNTIVFPGAGFLEMCLSGAFCTVQSLSEDLVFPRRPIVLKGLKIQSPLALYESQLCVLQTVVNLDEKDDDAVGYNVEVFRQDSSESNGAGRWIPHASAKFLPVAPKLEPQVSKPIDILTIQSSWESTDNKEFYEKLPEVGLRFGPKFQSLEMGWQNEQGILLQVKVPEDNANYLIHPVVADAMIQAIMLWTSKEKLKKKLHVPVHVEQFIWLSQTQSKNLFVYCSNNEKGREYALLVDENGEGIAYMGAVDFAETSVKLVESMIEQQQSALPAMWEEVWKNAPGKLQSNILFEHIVPTTLTPEQKQQLQAHNELGEEEDHLYASITHYTKLYFLNALYDLGWKPEIGSSFTTKELISSLGVIETFTGYSHFFLTKWAEMGYLDMFTESQFRSKFYLKKLLPTKENIFNIFNSTLTPYIIKRPDYKLIKEIGENLTSIFKGNLPALSVLFSDDPSKATVEDFYQQIVSMHAKTSEPWRFNVLPMLKQGMEKSKTTNVDKTICRILEIGAGTGSYTERFLKTFAEFEITEFEYWYTDVSGAFSTHADRIFADIPEKLMFKKFNIDEDPLKQGIHPEYFDIILASEVLHVAKDLKSMLHNIRSILKPHGTFQITETVQQSPTITYTFGLLEGYWQFQDFDLRPNHTTLSLDKWQETLESTGFYQTVCTSVYYEAHGFISCYATSQSQLEIKSLKQTSSGKKHSWILFSNNSDTALKIEEHLDSLNRKVVIVPQPNQTINEETANQLVANASAQATENKLELEGIIYLWGLSNDIRNRDQSTVSLPFVSLCQFLSKLETKPPRTYIITQSLCSIDDSEVINPVAAPLFGIGKSMHNECTHINLFYMDLCPTKSSVNQSDEILSNLWLTKDFIVAFRNGKRYCSRLAETKIQNDYISLPSGCDRFQLVLPKTKVISDLEFGYLDPYEIGENEIEIQVKAMALNFRDVFTVLKPTNQFDKINSVGLDFAGIVSKVGSKVTTRKVGDHVLGMNREDNLSLPSHIKIAETLVVQIPETMTFAEGVTLPAVFSTALYCLETIAKMKKGETLLVHTASGGVGLCAIQLAKRFGVNVIATAGSKRKQNYLRNLGIQHVFHSRTTDYGQQILAVTNGKGVDIVLNSLTGEGFKEASLGALALNGRFIEMSKLNVWEPEEVKALRPDVFYQVVDLTSLEKKEYEKLSVNLEQYLREGFVKPIAYETFDALNIRGALYYLQKAKHIGKIICLMPERKIENSKIVIHTPLFNEQSTYLITGGLGGIGFEVAKYMLKNGAKYIALVSRSKPKPDTEKIIAEWNKHGKQVRTFAVDIGNFEQTSQLFEDLKSPKLGFPPLRGVMHAAGVLRDAIIQKQTWDSFYYTFNPKVNGSWNLHDLTKDLLLEHFVVFSSMAALLGSPGQTNHAASNYFEDVFSLYRRSIGLPSTSINWGNWGEIGVATEVDIAGVRPISTSQGLLALEAVLKSQRSHLSVLNVESFAIMLQLFPSLKQFLADKRLFGENKSALHINSDEFWQKVDSAQDRDEKVEVFKTFIKITAKNILKFDDIEEVDDNADFQVLGIDSLMMLEMKNCLQNVLGTRLILTVEQLKNCTTTEILANKLVNILEGQDSSDENVPTTEELRNLIREDSILPENISACKELTRKDITAIKTVLVTGVTGVLGPYLLRELSNRANITKIYCLIRKSGKIPPTERLLKRLNTIGIADQINMSKVEGLQGDISYEKFGLSENKYNALAEEVDAVIHSAVRSDHTAKYWKSPDTKKNSVRAVNVKGTLRLLEFAVSKSLKYVYYASTLLVVATTNEDNSLSEDWVNPRSFDDLTYNAGYPISKFVSEQLIAQATERGVPCKIFRYGAIAGDSQTGRCEYLNNHIVLRWLAYLKLRCVPDLITPIHLLSVDHCADISLNLFFNKDAPWEPYNITPNTGSMDQNIIDIAHEMGIEIQPVSFSEFVAKLKMEDDDSPLSQFKSTYEEEEKVVLENFEGNPSVKALQKYIENSDNFFKSLKLEKYLQTWNKYESTEFNMKRDIQFLKNSGILEKFGII